MPRTRRVRGRANHRHEHNVVRVKGECGIVQAGGAMAVADKPEVRRLERCSYSLSSPQHGWIASQQRRRQLRGDSQPVLLHHSQLCTCFPPLEMEAGALSKRRIPLHQRLEIPTRSGPSGQYGSARQHGQILPARARTTDIEALRQATTDTCTDAGCPSERRLRRRRMHHARR